MAVDHITPQVKALIGTFTDWYEAPHPVEGSEVRRVLQGVMAPGPLLAPDGREMAPPAFVVHMFRRPLSDAADPLDAGVDADFDGEARRLRAELPPVPIKLPRVVNGGYDHEFYSHALVGERIRRRSRYKDIHQREGKSGPIVFVIVEDEYETVDGRPIERSTNTQIMR